jgi:hypothetical protein
MAGEKSDGYSQISDTMVLTGLVTGFFEAITDKMRARHGRSEKSCEGRGCILISKVFF